MFRKRFRTGKLLIGLLLVIATYIILAIASKTKPTTFSDMKFSETDLIPISQNPDLIFDVTPFANEFSTFFKQEKGINVYPLSLFNISPFSGEAVYYPGEMPKNSGNKGIIILHPLDKDRPLRFVYRLSVPSDGFYVLYIKYADIANYFERETCPDCRDVLMKVKITDVTTNATETVLEDVVDARDGWKQAFINLSTYEGKSVEIAVEAWAGGPCGVWCAEWLGIDKFYVGKLIQKLI
jgi:hypothetical protein